MDTLFFQKEKIGLQIPDFRNQTIFYCVLNWGIGHATRSVPIIKQLLDQQNEVILFSDGEAENLLKTSFPNLTIQSLPSYKIQYKAKKNLLIDIALQSVTRLWVLNKEYYVLKKYAKKYSPSIVISDNRYGCNLKTTENYLITHQLKLVANNWIERLSPKFIGMLIKPFRELWIPDIESVKLSGNMTEVKFPIVKRWIGFPKLILPTTTTLDYKSKLLILLSGPEPRRSELEAIYLKTIPRIPFDVTFIAGNFSKGYVEKKEGNLNFFSFKKYEETIQHISAADMIVCRSGYSTLIDLYILGKEKIICIPTAGQPEQEYLASYWSQKGWVKTINEDEIEEKLVSEVLKLDS